MQEFKVPQDVDVEDKLIGPLSFRQFFIVLAGVMAGYLIFETTASSLPILLSLVLTFLPPLITFAFAIIKIDGQPMSKVLVAALLYITKPSKRVFYKQPEVDDLQITDSQKDKNKQAQPKKQVSRSRMEELAQVLDTEGWAEKRN